MRRQSVLIVFLIIFGLFLGALAPCQADQEPWVCPNNDEANGIYWICNYFPLNPNNQWQYTTGEYHVVNDVHTCSSGYSGILYKTTTYVFSSYMYMQNGEDGLLFAGCQYDEGVFEDMGINIVLIPSQMHVGETVRTFSNPKSTLDVTLVGLETITVPAGTFSTLKIEMMAQDIGECSYKTTIWLAKGIGMVKIHRTDANPADCLGCIFVCDPNNNVVKLNTPAELISFDVNQGTPKMSVSPMSVNLGSVKAGSTSNPRTVTIKNTGNGDLIINSIAISGTNQSEFIESNNCSIVPAKSSCSITVTLSPVPPFVKKTAIMSISSNDPKKPTINVKLLGQAPPPKITVSPKSVNFGSVAVGTTSASKIVTIKNTGTSDLTVNAIAFAGTNAAEFGETNNCATLTKGSSCSISITFSPTSAGTKTATMSISSNDPKKPVINVKLGGKSGSGGAGDGGSQTPSPLTQSERDAINKAISDTVTTAYSSSMSGVNDGGVTPNGSMTWVVADKCDDGLNVNFKFFDSANNRVWPSANGYYYTSAYNTAYQTTLACFSGYKVCIGGQSGQYTWGVGLDGKQSCSNCCAICDGRTYSYNFGCGGQAATSTTEPLIDIVMLTETATIESGRVAEIKSASITATPTDCQGNPTVCHSVTVNIFNERMACPVSGRATTNGNMKAYDTGVVGGQFTTQFSDPTNNLYDCEVSNDLFIDGPIYVGISGNVNGSVTLTISGDIEIARRGPAGGLIPIDSAFGIFLTISI